MVAKKHAVGVMLSDFAADLGKAKDIEVAMDVLQDSMGKLGFPMVDYAYVQSPRLPTGKWMPPSLKTRNFPRRWDAQWDRHNINDPYYHACFEERAPIKWIDVQNRTDISLDQSKCCKYLSDKGMNCGVTIPMHMYDGSFSFISVIGENENDNWYSSVEKYESALVNMAHYFNNTVYAKFGIALRSAFQDPLSVREAECLSWAAQGKTSDEIAAILGISVETVRIYTKRVYCKLDAVNRTHAVAKAVYLGLVKI